MPRYYITALAGGLAFAFVALFVIAHSGMPLFASDQTWFGIVSSLAGPAIASVAGILAWLGYLVNRTGARAARFQKGAEMASSNSLPLALGGIQVIKDIVREDGTYRVAAIKVLSGLVMASDYEAKKQYDPWHRPFDEESYKEFKWPVSDLRGAEALGVLGRIRLQDGTWPDFDDASVDGLVPVGQLYFCGKIFTGDDFRWLELGRAILHQTTFTDCDFTGTVLTAVIGNLVVFENCTLDGMTLKVRSVKGVPLEHPVYEGHLRIVSPKSTKDFIIDGMSYEAWLDWGGSRSGTTSLPKAATTVVDPTKHG